MQTDMLIWLMLLEGQHGYRWPSNLDQIRLGLHDRQGGLETGALQQI